MVGGYGRGCRHRHWYYATGVPGYGRGRGYCWPGPPGFAYPQPMPEDWWYQEAPPELSPAEELNMLEEDEQILSEELDEIRKRLDELRNEVKKEVK